MTREEMIISNRGLVHMVARKHCRDERFIEDLVSEGNVGLVIAADRFDPTKGVKFSTYAVYWIQAHIWSYITNQCHSVVRIPVGSTDIIRSRIPRAVATLDAAGIEATDEMVAAHLGVAAKDVTHARSRALVDDTSLYRPVYNNSEKTLMDILQSGSGNPEEALFRSECRTVVKDCIAYLEPRDRDILLSRFSDQPESLGTIGKRWGLSRERVRQLQLSAMRQLRRLIVSPRDHVMPMKTDTRTSRRAVRSSKKHRKRHDTGVSVAITHR